MDFSRNQSWDDLWPKIENNFGIFNQIVQNMPLGIFVVDSDRNLVYANPAMSTLLDCNYDELSEILISVREAQQELVEVIFDHVFRLQSEFVVPEFGLTLPSGKLLYLHATFNPISFQQGDQSVSAMIAVALDITAKKNAADLAVQHAREFELLHSAGQRLSETLDLDVIFQIFFELVSSIMSHDGLFVSSYDDEEEMITCKYAIIEGNEIDVTQLPAIPLEPEGMGTQSVVIRTGKPMLIHDMDARLMKTQSVHYVDENDKVFDLEDVPEEAPRTQSALLVPLILDGKCVGAIQVMSFQKNAFSESDLRIMQALAAQIAVASNNALLYEQAQEELTERTKLQIELEEERNLLSRRVEERTAELIAANQELQQALQIKDEFLANMSHELRTPLNAILGMRESLSDGIYGPLDQRQERPLGLIQQSGEHLLDLINDVLDLTKVQAGHIESKPVPILLEAISKECLKLVDELAVRKNIHVHFNPGEGRWQVRADERQLKQVLLNLLSNAIKFTDENGSVGIDICAGQKLDQVNLTVWDTGIGIKQADMGKLFQPFVQLDSGLSRKYEGTGLGLALSAKLVELHGGKISVESEGMSGKGSRFKVTLPTVTAGSEGSPATALDGDTFSYPMGSSERILVVEDNPANLETMVSFIELSGYEVLVANNGQEAIDRTRDAHPDLILMDIQLPVMDGLTAIRVIRQDMGMTEIPIIALTALAMQGDEERCLAAGADLYLSKPVRLRTLVETVGKMLKG
jgi:PAS domain S-box-containing protein